VTRLRNGLALLLLVGIGLRVGAALVQPLLVPLALLLALVVLVELLLDRRRRW
jgi:hypothetical protein